MFTGIHHQVNEQFSSGTKTQRLALDPAKIPENWVFYETDTSVPTGGPAWIMILGAWRPFAGAGATGATGPSGGPAGPTGPTGPSGGPIGPTGPTGPSGGPVGPTGPAGGLLAYAGFYATMPGDNATTIGVTKPVLFPNDGPAFGTSIGRTNIGVFTLAPGTYEISWQVSVDEPGQLGLLINSILQDGAGGTASTVAGRATGTSLITNDVLITIPAGPPLSMSVVNPAGNPAALTITPIAGGTHAVSAWLVVKRLA